MIMKKLLLALAMAVLMTTSTYAATLQLTAPNGGKSWKRDLQCTLGPVQGRYGIGQQDRHESPPTIRQQPANTPGMWASTLAVQQ
jgi:hypothetical protein